MALTAGVCELEGKSDVNSLLNFEYRQKLK